MFFTQNPLNNKGLTSNQIGIAARTRRWQHGWQHGGPWTTHHNSKKGVAGSSCSTVLPHHHPQRRRSAAAKIRSGEDPHHHPQRRRSAAAKRAYFARPPCCAGASSERTLLDRLTAQGTHQGLLSGGRAGRRDNPDGSVALAWVRGDIVFDICLTLFLD